jgi:quaternary ammonium compound-resistance protein SugE
MTPTTTAWLQLLVAGLLEVAWAVGLKYTGGFAHPIPSLIILLTIIANIGLLGLSLRTLPVGTAYAVWTGIGAAGTVIVGILLLGESAHAARLGCVALIVAGIVGLKLFSQA